MGTATDMVMMMCVVTAMNVVMTMMATAIATTAMLMMMKTMAAKGMMATIAKMICKVCKDGDDCNGKDGDRNHDNGNGDNVVGDM